MRKVEESDGKGESDSALTLAPQRSNISYSADSGIKRHVYKRSDVANCEGCHCARHTLMIQHHHGSCCPTSFVNLPFMSTAPSSIFA